MTPTQRLTSAASQQLIDQRWRSTNELSLIDRHPSPTRHVPTNAKGHKQGPLPNYPRSRNRTSIVRIPGCVAQADKKRFREIDEYAAAFIGLTRKEPDLYWVAIASH